MMGHYDSSYEYDEEEKRKSKKVRGFLVSFIGSHDYFGDFFVLDDEVFSGGFVVDRYDTIREVSTAPREGFKDAIECAEISVKMLKALNQYLQERPN